MPSFAKSGSIKLGTDLAIIDTGPYRQHDGTMLKAHNWIKWKILMRRPSKFKKSDVTRATKAVRAAGLKIARVEITQDGSIIVVPAGPLEVIQNDETSEDLKRLI